jgi:ABC-type multidrug transport system ATPase subunit
VLDEPFNGVDAESIQVIAGELAHFALGGSVVLIAHALTGVLTPDRVIEISEVAGGL